MTRPCRWCPEPAVTAVATVERGTPGRPISVTYLCGAHDVTARTVRDSDRMLRRAGRPGIDVIVADVEVAA